MYWLGAAADVSEQNFLLCSRLVSCHFLELLHQKAAAVSVCSVCCDDWKAVSVLSCNSPGLCSVWNIRATFLTVFLRGSRTPPSLQILLCLMYCKCSSQVFIKPVCATFPCACRNHQNCPSQHGQRSQGGVPRGDTGQGHGRTHGRPLRDNQSDHYTHRCQWQPTKVPTEWVPTKSFLHLLPGPMLVKQQTHPRLEEAVTDGLLQHAWIKKS